jgi:ABC-type lipoprotein release transport system permease subunit
LARSFIAARSSSVNPSDFCVAFFALIVSSCASSALSYLSGSAVHPLRILVDGGFSTLF